MLAVGALTVAAAAPLAAAIFAKAPGWMVPLASLPLALLLTSLACFSTSVANDSRGRMRDLLAVDPVLALLVLAWAAGAVALCLQDGIAQVTGFVLVAIWVAVVPRSLAYAALRNRRGAWALRGGAILAVYRPGTTLTIIALGTIGGFVVVATLGTLVLVIPALLSVFIARVVRGELATIDAVQGTTR